MLWQVLNFVVEYSGPLHQAIQHYSVGQRVIIYFLLCTILYTQGALPGQDELWSYPPLHYLPSSFFWQGNSCLGGTISHYNSHFSRTQCWEYVDVILTLYTSVMDSSLCLLNTNNYVLGPLQAKSYRITGYTSFKLYTELRRMCVCAHLYIQTWSIETVSDRSNGCFKSSHDAGDVGILQVPADTADRAPRAIPVDLHTSLVLTA